MATKNVLKGSTNAEILSGIINMNPILSEEIDLPVQGEDIKPIGKIIMDNQRYRNAFINTINVLGLTVIKRNRWDNPWDFTIRGTLTRGQTVREIILDLCKAHSYNENFDNKTNFLTTEVPNIFQYLHNINFQIYYQTTTSDEQVAMAFETEGGLLSFIEEAVSMLWESMKYDEYIIDKYQLCRRILDGTVSSIDIEDYSTKTPRQRVSDMKAIANKMSFRSPNYNPAAVRSATRFDDQIFILNTNFEADLATDVLATSFFRDEADFKSRCVLIDGFDNHDTDRLSEVLGDQYAAFTEDELTQLSNIPACIVSREFFMDYYYGLDATSNGRMTEFFNPTTLENNHYLHIWGVKNTSPFENCAVFTTGVKPAVTSVTVSPAKATVSAGQSLQLSAVVATTGFANKAVAWSVTDTLATINQEGVLKVDASHTAGTITVTATSIYDNTKSATATITVA